MGIHESPQKILACADFYCTTSFGSTYSILAGIGGSTVYIYVVLGGKAVKVENTNER